MPNWEPQKSTKSHTSRKTPHQNASPIEACKKTPSGRGQTSEFDDGYTLSAVFSGAQGSEKSKWSQDGASGHPKSKKIKINWALKKTSKNNTAKSGLLVDSDLKSALVFRAGNVFEITKIRDILKMGPEVSKMSPRAFKITENHESDHPKSRKSMKQKSRKS